MSKPAITSGDRRLARKAILEMVNIELELQDEQWGLVDQQRSVESKHRLSLLAEEFGEYARAVVERDIYQQRAELIQVAAVAVANVELIDFLLRSGRIGDVDDKKRGPNPAVAEQYLDQIVEECESATNDA